MENLSRFDQIEIWEFNVYSWNMHIFKVGIEIRLKYAHLHVMPWHGHVMPWHGHAMTCHDMAMPCHDMTWPWHGMSWHDMAMSCHDMSCHDHVMTCHDMPCHGHVHVMSWFGQAGDWSLDLPHAKRVWYHYTTCPCETGSNGPMQFTLSGSKELFQLEFNGDLEFHSISDSQRKVFKVKFWYRNTYN